MKFQELNNFLRVNINNNWQSLALEPGLNYSEPLVFFLDGNADSKSKLFSSTLRGKL
jgi:hypothetical protein